METHYSDQNKEEAFWNWLKPRVTPKQLSEMFRYANDLKNHFAKYNGLAFLIDEMFRTSPIRVRRKISNDKLFQKNLSKYDRQYISSLLIHMENFVYANRKKYETIKKENPLEWKANSVFVDSPSSKQESTLEAQAISQQNPVKESDSVPYTVETLDFTDI